MRDIVIIPTCNRPEMLSLCLEKLSQADGAASKEYWINLDIKDSKSEYETSQVVFNCSLPHIRYTKLRFDPSEPGGNILNALKQASQTDAGLVYAMEDDILVTKDFFQFHEKTLKLYDVFLSMAVNVWTSICDFNHAQCVVLSYKDFEPWGFCIPTSHIKSIRFDKRHLEESLHDQITTDHLPVIFPVQPRAYNVGWYGTNSGGERPGGSLSERIDKVRTIAHTSPGLWKPFRDTTGCDGPLEIVEIRT